MRLVSADSETMRPPQTAAMMSSVQGGCDADAAYTAFERERQIDIAVLDQIRNGEENLEDHDPDYRCTDCGNRRKS